MSRFEQRVARDMQHPEVAAGYKEMDDYLWLVEMLNALIDRVGGDESHPLAPLMEMVGDMVAQYEEAHLTELEDKHS